MVCGECSCSRRGNRVISFSLRSGRGGMPWVRGAKGKNEACGRVSRDDLRGDACPMVSGHNKALACSANTHSHRNIIYYYESGIEIEFPGRLMRHPPAALTINQQRPITLTRKTESRPDACVRRACFCAKSHVPALWSGRVCVWFTRRDLISIRTATLIETRSVLRRPRGANGPIALTRTRISADPFYGHFHAWAIISH
jgi:hypothetical protein